MYEVIKKKIGVLLTLLNILGVEWYNNVHIVDFEWLEYSELQRYHCCYVAVIGYV